MPANRQFLRRVQWRGLVALAMMTLALALAQVLPARAAVGLLYFRATPDFNTIRVTWATATELNNVGFELFRSTSENQGYVSIRTEAAKGDGVTGAEYVFTDTNVVPGVKYFYRLEDISSTGARSQHGPVSATVPDGSSTSTPTPTATTPAGATATPTPTATLTPTPTATPTITATTNPNATATPTPTLTPTGLVTATPTLTGTPSPTLPPILTSTPTAALIAPTVAPTFTPTVTPGIVLPTATPPLALATDTPQPQPGVTVTKEVIILLPFPTPTPPASSGGSAGLQVLLLVVGLVSLAAAGVLSWVAYRFWKERRDAGQP